MFLDQKVLDNILYSFFKLDKLMNTQKLKLTIVKILSRRSQKSRRYKLHHHVTFW